MTTVLQISLFEVTASEKKSCHAEVPPLPSGHSQGQHQGRTGRDHPTSLPSFVVVLDAIVYGFGDLFALDQPFEVADDFAHDEEYVVVCDCFIEDADGDFVGCAWFVGEPLEGLLVSAFELSECALDVFVGVFEGVGVAW